MIRPLLMLVLGAAAGLAGAAGVPDEALDSMSYRLVGPHRGGRVTAAAGVPSQPWTFSMGATGGGVWRTTDAGITWSNVLYVSDTAGAVDLSTDPSNPRILFAAIWEMQRSPWDMVSGGPGSGLYRSRDGGNTWVRLADGGNGIPSGHFVRVVREDPVRRGLLYAGAEFGLYVSLDDGATWRPLQLDLPVTPVTDLAVKRGDLVVATQGRSYWILDDLSVLRQLADEILGAATPHLFAPRPAIRWRRQRREPALRGGGALHAAGEPRGRRRRRCPVRLRGGSSDA